jgi:hypothetical protein
VPGCSLANTWAKLAESIQSNRLEQCRTLIWSEANRGFCESAGSRESRKAWAWGSVCLENEEANRRSRVNSAHLFVFSTSRVKEQWITVAPRA